MSKDYSISKTDNGLFLVSFYVLSPTTDSNSCGSGKSYSYAYTDIQSALDFIKAQFDFAPTEG